MKTSREAPPWQGWILIAVLIPLLFWVRFRRIDGFAIGFTIFLLLLSVAIESLPRLGAKFENEASADSVKRSPLDVLGVVWLLAVPFAPLAMWALGELTSLTTSNWPAILGAKAFLCVVVPIICVLPLLRYVRGRAAPYALLILVVGTAFPVGAGWASAMDLLHGPQSERVVIDQVRRHYVSIRMRTIETPTLDVHLTDGRTLEADSTVTPHFKEGPAKLWVLESLGRIIGVD